MAWFSSILPGNGTAKERGRAALFSCAAVHPRPGSGRRLATALLLSTIAHGSLLLALAPPPPAPPAGGSRPALFGRVHAIAERAASRSAPARIQAPAMPPTPPRRPADAPPAPPVAAPATPPPPVADALPAGRDTPLATVSAAPLRRAFRVRGPVPAAPPPMAWANQAQAAQARAQQSAALARRLSELATLLAGELAAPLHCQRSTEQDFVCQPEAAAGAQELIAQMLAAAVEAHYLGMASRPFHLELAPGRSLDIDW